MARTKSRTRYSFTQRHENLIQIDQVSPNTWAGHIKIGEALHLWEVFVGVGPTLQASAYETSVLSAKRQAVKWHRKLNEVAR